MTNRCAVLLVTLASASACAARMPSPQPVPLDRAECAFCRMLVSTERGAAEIVPVDGDARFYDDVGCMAADWTAHAADARAFVQIDGRGWVDAASAFYAKPEGARTAMGSGVVAFATAADARAAARNGDVSGFDDVVRAAGAHR